MRILGAWVGNKVNQVLVWANTLDRISDNVERWKKCHPTLFGKKNIAQMIVAGMSQYLTVVQGMPKGIEDNLTRIIRDLFWNGSKAPISLERLHVKKENRGLGLVDIRVRNEAANLMWAKKYLSMGDTRPMWVLLADDLILRSAPKNQTQLDNTVIVNSFLQSWHHATYPNSKLQPNLLRMLRTAEKHNLWIESLILSDKAKESLPTWYHIGSKNHPSSLHRRQTVKCLKEKHKVIVVGDLVKITKRLIDNSPEHSHSRRKNCKCKYCREDIRKGCTDPNKCTLEALEVLDRMHPKYDPRNKPPADNLSLTPRRKQRNKSTTENNEVIL